MNKIKTIAAVALAGCISFATLTGCNVKLKWKSDNNTQTTTQTTTQAPTEAESTGSLKNEDGKYVSMEAYFADPMVNYTARNALSGSGYTVEIIAEENTVVYEVHYVMQLTEEDIESIRNTMKEISPEKKDAMIKDLELLTEVVDVDTADIKVAYRFMDNKGNMICQTDFVQKEE